MTTEKRCIRCNKKFNKRLTKNGNNCCYCLSCKKDTGMDVYDD